MSTLTSQPMSLLRVDFQELYVRHLCRHSQFGINVAHLVALFGTWFGVYGIVYWQVRAVWPALAHLAEWVAVVMAGCYLAALALTGTPPRVLAVTVVFLALFLAALFWLPELPVWVYLVMIPVFYELQSLSHKVFTASRDMTEFNRKYSKGRLLFVLLLFYEVPIVLNYLVFGRKDWAA
jgi:hypothetical protein